MSTTSTTSTLYLTFGANGGIWAGKPNTDTGPEALHKEASGTSDMFYQAASDNDITKTNYNVLVVTGGGKILKSQRTGSSTGTWSIAYNGGTPLYALAYGELASPVWISGGQNNTVVYSTDQTNWYVVPGAVRGAQWSWAAYGNGTFVMVGFKTISGVRQGAVQYSNDGGITWTEANPGTKSILQSIAYSPTLNMFVAVGANGAIVQVKG
jgi:hypothetical protein